MIGLSRANLVKQLRREAIQAAIDQVPEPLVIWETVGNLLRDLLAGAGGIRGLRDGAVLAMGILEEVFIDSGVDVDQILPAPQGAMDRAEEWTLLLVQKFVPRLARLPGQWRAEIDKALGVVGATLAELESSGSGERRPVSRQLLAARRRRYRQIMARIREEGEAEQRARERERELRRHEPYRPSGQETKHDVTDNQLLEV